MGPPLPHTAGVRFLEFGPDNKLLLSGSEREIQLWDVVKMTPRFPPLKPEGKFTAAVLMPARKALATAEEFERGKSIIRVRDLDTGQPSGPKLEVPNAVIRLQFHDKEGLLYLVGLGGGQHRVWYLASGKVNAWGSSTVPGRVACSVSELAPSLCSVAAPCAIGVGWSTA